MYVKVDIVGSETRRTYAKAGDKLTVLKYGDLCLCDNGVEKFWVRKELLTTEPCH